MPLFGWGSQKQKPKAELLSYDTWRQRYVREDCGALYVLYNQDGSSSPRNAVTVSEASGWAMLAAALADRRQDLEGFLRFYERYPNWNGLMCWQIISNQGKLVVNPEGGSGCATDGDLDTAYALLLAGRKWGCEELRRKGLKICALLWQHCVNKRTGAPLVGDWVHPSGEPSGGPTEGSCGGPGVDMYWATRPSDFCLTHFALFAQEDREHARDWQRVAESCVQYLLSSMANPHTGLVPDFAVWDGALGAYKAPEGKVLEKDEDKVYFWNSCRVPWRLAAHRQLSDDPRLGPLMQRLAAFSASQDCIAAGYSLDGQPLVDYTDLAFLAPFWALLQALGHEHAQVLRRHIKERLKQDSGRYYGETILLLCQLQLRSQQPGQCTAPDQPLTAV